MPTNWFRKLIARRDTSAIGCLDFGTAFSKVAVVDAEQTVDLDERSVHMLPIGEGISSNPLLLPSLLFVSDDRVLFGQAAEREARRQERRGRSAFLSPKQHLSTHALGNLDDPLSSDIDPSGAYTARKLITLYLAFLVRRAEWAAAKIKAPWPVPFRVARPAWDAERAHWGEEALRNMVRHALVLSERFDRELLASEALPHSVINGALQELPASVDQSDERIFVVSEQDTVTVSEATAVGAGSIRPRGRRVVVVADIGGGTSDFAAFMTGLPGRNIVAEISGSANVLREAGDFLDMQLRRILSEKAGFLPDDPAAQGAMAELRARQRQLKETLFFEGRLTQDFGDFSIQLAVEEFLDDERVKKFADRLCKTFQKTADLAILCAKDFSPPGHRVKVEVLATGGGHALPMVDEMVSTLPGDWEYARIRPEIFRTRDSQKAADFIRLAVAIGGAVDELPKETAPIDLGV
jgi:molecular chaperone DnaK (HSP70)